MSQRRHLPRGHQRGERGAAFVEFALVSPVLLMLVFGMIDYGIMFKDQITIETGIGESARQLTVGTIGTDTSCTTTGLSSAQLGTPEHRLVCDTKNRAEVGPGDTRIKIDVTADGYTEGKDVLICVTYPVYSTTGFLAYLNSRTAQTSVQLQIHEKATDTPTLPIQETPYPGNDWSWCTFGP